MVPVMAALSQPAPISFKRTHNMKVVHAIITDPEIYPYSTDDGCPPPEEFHPINNLEALYMVISIGFRVAGLWIFTPSNHFAYEVHAAILPWARGRFAVQSAKEMCAWIWENTTCERIWTSTPAFNERALWLVRQAGMVEFGRNPRSFKKNGVLWDQVLSGISRPTVEIR